MKMADASTMTYAVNVPVPACRVIGQALSFAQYTRAKERLSETCPRRAQNLPAGCTYDGLACQKCFCVTLDKSNRTAHDGIRDSYVHTARLRSAGLMGGDLYAENHKCNGR